MINKLILKEAQILNFLYLMFILGSLYAVYRGTHRQDYLKQNCEFTIGRAFEYTGTGGNNGFVAYKYFVNGSIYKGDVRRNFEKASPLGKYYVLKYSKIKPEISEIYLNEEVTDSGKIVKAGFKYQKE
ncbi:hypothetical protein [Flavobacterium sp. LM4]|uniref:hypothetical protein n=1 Tax=Flavobacterium sp. LM4 TaxID=1938609 RepID=UPI000992454A|nr:hypothetical protein [Flavobacterium sp. LM4]OOV17729.1 hypothetical protein BXU10_16875 [Flavobacterium sp. LM4]